MRSTASEALPVKKLRPRIWQKAWLGFEGLGLTAVPMVSTLSLGFWLLSALSCS